MRFHGVVNDTAGDASFEEAFDDLFARATRLARRILGDSTAAEDVAAEALARAYARWDKVQSLPWRDAWVLRVASNAAIDVARRRKRFDEVAAVDVGRSESDDVAIRLALVSALLSLPRRQREAVALRYLGGFSEAQVATALGVSAGTVKTHLHRGIAALRGRLGETFGEGSSLAVE
jgi:RNA polymerase sigma-70 factor (sigma-E family)